MGAQPRQLACRRPADVIMTRRPASGSGRASERGPRLRQRLIIDGSKGPGLASNCITGHFSIAICESCGDVCRVPINMLSRDTVSPPLSLPLMLFSFSVCMKARRLLKTFLLLSLPGFPSREDPPVVPVWNPATVAVATVAGLPCTPHKVFTFLVEAHVILSGHRWYTHLAVDD